MSAPAEEPHGSLVRDARPRGQRANRGSGGGIGWRPAWKFKGNTKAFLARVLEIAPKPIVHVCCGSSSLGDVLVDIVHANAEVKADARHMPFRDAGTVLIDPPFDLKPRDRWAYLRGCIDSIRPGGLFILHAPWMPKRLRCLTLEDVHVREPGGGLTFPRPPVLVSVYRVGKVRRAHVSRWRRVPDKRWAIRQGMRPGALDEAHARSLGGREHED